MKVNDIVISKVENQRDFSRFMDELNLQGNVFIIKPNWVDGTDGSFTEARVLELVFEYLKDKKLFIIESYTIWRNQPCTEQGVEEIPASKGNLIDAKSKHEWIEKQDNWFLENKGIEALLEKYNVEYINITEEVWSGRTVDAGTIQELVDGNYKPVMFKELYSYVPQKLFDVKGATLISLSKLKTGQPGNITASTKNIFGLIPDPSRFPKYHGENNKLIAQSIVDANKIYRSLFKTVFITEGIFTAISGCWPENFETIRNWGQIVGGRNSAEVDSVIATMIGLAHDKISYLPLVKETFGGFNQDVLNKIPKEFIKPINLA